MADVCTIREAVESDLPHVMEWWRDAFNFEFDLETLKIMLQHGEGGGSFTAVTSSGEPIGFVNCAVAGDTAFGGHYIVRRDARGTGAGRLLSQRLLAHVGGQRSLGINSVAYRVAPNKKIGFTTESFTMTFRYYTVNHAAPPPLDDDDVIGTTSDDVIVKPYDEGMLEAVLAYDRGIAGHDRGAYLRPCLRAYGKLTMVAMDAAAAGAITGYAVASDMTGCVSHGIFPLYGDDPRVQRHLLASLLAALPDGAEACALTPDANAHASRMLERIGFRYDLQTTRMYTGRALILPLQKCLSNLNFDACAI
ncbi:PREDICTED: uncharacterized protein LOC106812793 [Priapulus caudatus]|uniref:Uncharacterized protein LOC106812793 n=1 Tax=Priapulus caudatus TaxID=37621 RepID=A0ABM1EJ82_PRICU|nr:PREDICTED: uncharacterized protein LOC106812793 [Priapulus caudatus]